MTVGASKLCSKTHQRLQNVTAFTALGLVHRHTALTSCMVPVKHFGSPCVALFMLGCTRVNKDAKPKPSKQGGCQAEFEVGGQGGCSLETGAEPDFTFFPLFL